MAQPIATQANQYEVYGNGFGDLVYQGTLLAEVNAFRDSGQQPLGNPNPLYTIDSKVPQTIISSQALQPGKLEIYANAQRDKGSWGSILNGRFANAKNLDELLSRIRSEQEALQMEWVDLDGEGNPVKELVYKGVTTVKVSSGLQTSTCVINAMYTDVSEKHSTEKIL